MAGVAIAALPVVDFSARSNVKCLDATPFSYTESFSKYSFGIALFRLQDAQGGYRPEPSCDL